MADYCSPEGLIFGNSSYAEIMNTIVLPELAKKEEVHRLTTSDRKALYCVSYSVPDARGTVLIVHGFTENALKYAELIHSLLANGYSVISYDQRGHGRSWRDPDITNASVTHVDRMDDYVSDLQLVVHSVMKSFSRPWFVFAHSMGGAVTSLALEKNEIPFAGAALCAPMIAPNLSGIPAAVARAICQAGIRIGKGKKYPFFMKPYAGPEDFDTSNATDPFRFKWYDEIKFSHSEFQNSVPTYRWTLESIRVTSRILAPGAPEKISCPVILYTAEKDGTVLPEPQEAFIHRVPRGKHEIVLQARHEIFRSEDAVLFPWWRSVLSFFDASAK